MRPLKFRAWHPSANGEGLGAMFFVGDSFGTKHPLDCCVYAMQGQPVELMQFTGLLDSKGVEIYEGDIVRLVYIKCEGGGWKSNSKEIGRVYFDSTWGVKFDCKDLTQRTAESHWKVKAGRFNDATDVEVIGNIHENPELLK